MGQLLILLVIAFALLRATFARPFPELDDSGHELLVGQDTRSYGLPLFWFGRPLYDDGDDDFGGNGGQNFELSRRSSTVSYAAVGAGWGR